MQLNPLKNHIMTTTELNNYRQKQAIARKIESFANTDRWNNHSFFEIAFNQFGKFINSIEKLDVFAAKVAETVNKSMNPYGQRVATVSNKQAWILACAAVENGIEF